MTSEEHLRLSALELAVAGSSHDVVGRAEAYLAFLMGTPLDAVVPTIEQMIDGRSSVKPKTPVKAMLDALATFPVAPPSKPLCGASAVAKIATGKRGKKS